MLFFELASGYTFAMKAIILAAGRGTRLKPLTDNTPKTLISVGNKTILERILDSLPEEIDEVIIVADYLMDQIEAFAEMHSSDRRRIKVIRQDGVKKGTMSALLSAKPHLANERFLVINGDDIHEKKWLEEMLRHERSFGAQMMNMPGYHAVREKDGFISHLERGVFDQMVPVATGTYVLDEKIFDIEPVVLRDGEIGLAQTIMVYKDSYPVKYIETTGWIPINSHEDLDLAEKIILNK